MKRLAAEDLAERLHREPADEGVRAGTVDATHDDALDRRRGQDRERTRVARHDAQLDFRERAKQLERRAPAVHEDRLARLDERGRRARDRDLLHAVAPSLLVEVRLALEPASRYGSPVRAVEETLLFERHEVAPDRHHRHAEAFAELVHADDAPLVDELEDLALPFEGNDLVCPTRPS